MKIYLDVFFLVNTGMNFSVLVMESFFQKNRIRLLRLLGAAALGGFLVTLFVISGIHRFRLPSLLVYAAGSAGLVRFAFGRTTVRTWGRNFILFYVTSFLFSGVLQYIQSVTRQQGNLILILSGTGAVLYAVYRFLPALRRGERKKALYLPVRLQHGGKKVQGSGLLDTGNHLTEPFSGRPVAISGMDFVTPLFAGEEPLFRYIPYHAIGTEHGTLRAFQAECLELRGEDGMWSRIERPWIAINDNPVSADGEYEIILHPDLVH